MGFTATLPDKPTADQVRERLLEAGHYYGELRSLDPSKRGEGYEADLRSAATFIRDADLILTAVERGAPVIPNPGTGILGGGPNHAMGMGNPEARSLGQLVTQDKGYTDFAQKRQSGATYQEVEIAGSLFLQNHAFRAPITSAEPGGGVFRPVGQPLPPHVRQMRMFLRDLISVQQTTLSTIPYIREVNPTATEYSASAVAENTAKPEVVLDWTTDDAPVRKIAAWVPVTTEIIDDAPTLQGYIDARLAYMLAVREEYEILNGDGNSPHLKGILQYADLQQQAFVTDAMISIGRAIGLVENVDGEADGIAMNPLDYWEMITARHSTQFDGDGIAGPGLPYANASNLGAWGLPVVRSRAVTRGHAIVACWGMGTTLFDRMQTTIRIGNQHSDYFTNNKVAVLAEERVALAVHRPDFFVRTDIAA